MRFHCGAPMGAGFAAAYHMWCTPCAWDAWDRACVSTWGYWGSGGGGGSERQIGSRVVALVGCGWLLFFPSGLWMAAVIS